jgi:hypothetical protein
MATNSRKQEGIQHDHQADYRTGGYEVSSQDFHLATGNEWLDIVEGSASSQMKEKTSKTEPYIDIDGGTTGSVRTLSGTTWDEQP